MKNTMFVLAPGVIVEDLGSDSAVFVPGVAEVLTLSGDAAAVIRRIRSGESVDGAQAVLSDLVARGVIQPAHGMSRRGVVRAGVIGAGVGVAALAMPGVAAAASSNVGGGGPQPVGLFVFRATGDGSPRWEFYPQPLSLATEVNDFVTGTGTSTLTLATGQTTTNWVVEQFRLPGSDPGLFGESIEGTWTLGPGVTRTQTFNRQRSGTLFT